MASTKEVSFRESADLMFDRATSTLDLPPGLADQIKGLQEYLPHP